MDSEPNQDSAIAGFIEKLRSVPWFENIGKPLPPNTTAIQLRRWEDWPGPHEPAVFELSARQQRLHDDILAQSEGRREDLTNLWNRVHQIVFAYASPAVPFEPDEDSWHGPTAAVWQAAWTAGLVAWCVLVRRTIPADLDQQWTWFLLGHWPSGYVEVEADDRFLVF